MTALSGLAAQLRDFLFLPDDLDLPGLHAVTLTSRHSDEGWTAHAQLRHGRDDTDTWGRMTAWADALGAAIGLGPALPDATKPSGRYRQVHVTVSHVGVLVTVWVHLDAVAAQSFDEARAEAEVASATQFGPVPR